MNRISIINNLIKEHGYSNYLEIGVAQGTCFKKVKCENKTGVDPKCNGTHAMTSDAFFKINKDKFDIVFIDGLHVAEQVERDILNSLACLKKGGTIVCHDMNPPSEKHQKLAHEMGQWCGDCWKAWVRLRRTRKDLTMFVHDCDFGVGVITRGKQKLLTDNLPLTWNNLEKNRVTWLNLV